MENFEEDCKLDDRKIERTDDILYDNTCIPICKLRPTYNCNLFKTLLVISALTPGKNCGNFLYRTYSLLIFLLLCFIVVDFILFNFMPNPFDIGILIYYLFFIMFFVYARYCYDIRQHYDLLIKNKILSEEEKNKVNTCIKVVTPICFTLLLIFGLLTHTLHLQIKIYLMCDLEELYLITSILMYFQVIPLKGYTFHF